MSDSFKPSLTEEHIYRLSRPEVAMSWHDGLDTLNVRLGNAKFDVTLDILDELLEVGVAMQALVKQKVEERRQAKRPAKAVS